MTADSADLRSLWTSAARHASDGQLVACVVVAVVTLVAFLLGLMVSVAGAFRWWPIVLPGLFAGAFGAWAIADREIVQRESKPDSMRAPRTLRAARLLAAVAASIIGMLGVLGLLRITLGTWIS